MRWIILQKSETEVKVKNLPDLTEYVEKVEFISLKRVKKTGCVKWWVSNTTLQRPLECEKHHQIPSVWAGVWIYLMEILKLLKPSHKRERKDKDIWQQNHNSNFVSPAY